jgi:S-layer homology domain
MTNIPPSDPQSSRSKPLDFDDFIGILVAFTTIGVILFWSFSRRESGFNFGSGLIPVAPSVPPTTEASPSSIPTAFSPVLPVLPSTVPQVGVEVPPPVSVEPVSPPPPIEQVAPNLDLSPFFDLTPQEPVIIIPPRTSTNTIQEEFPVVQPAEKLPTIPPPIAFRDVGDDFWGRSFINVLSSRNIIKGFEDYTYRPNEPVTRAQFAAILQSAFDKQIRQNKFAFTDIPANYWATPAINKSISSGFLKGYPDKTFQPNQRIPRVQVLVALISGLNLKAPTDPDKVLSIYKDAKDIPSYAKEKIATATVNGMVVNYPDVKAFEPNKEATRAEVAGMVHQSLVRLGRLKPIKSENIVRWQNTPTPAKKVN